MMNDFKEALIKLGIEDYHEDIFHAHSHGELMHLVDYIDIANQIDFTPDMTYKGINYKNGEWFKFWFKHMADRYGNKFYCNVLEVLNKCIKGR